MKISSSKMARKNKHELLMNPKNFRAKSFGFRDSQPLEKVSALSKKENSGAFPIETCPFYNKPIFKARDFDPL